MKRIAREVPEADPSAASVFSKEKDRQKKL